MADKITVRMPEDLQVRLKVVAAGERKTITEIINGLVTSYVNAKQGAA